MNFNLHKSNPALLMLLALFSCALLLDFGNGTWPSPRSGAIIALAVVLQFFNFRWWWCTLLSIIVCMYKVFPLLPKIPNHTFVELFTGITILILVLRKIIVNKGLNVETITWVFRYALVAIYFWAGFHKLNSGFFNLEGSCTVAINRSVRFLVSDHFTVSDGVLRLFQILTVFVELVLPVGILFKSTRKVTAVMLVLFHAYLSLCYFANFSAFAAFLLAGSVIDLRAKHIPKNTLNGFRWYLFFAIVSVLTSYFITRFHVVAPRFNINYPEFETLFAKRVHFFNGVVFNIGLLVFFFKMLFSNSSTPPYSSSRKFSPAASFVAILISLWATQGYFGLSNAGTLTMFSNLITEESRSNHYLVNTAYTKIWNFEEDYVTIISAPDGISGGIKYNDEDFDIPMIQFRYLCNKWIKKHGEKLSCTIMYKGKVITITDFKASRFSHSEWWQDYLLYRPIPKEGVHRCLW